MSDLSHHQDAPIPSQQPPSSRSLLLQLEATMNNLYDVIEQENTLISRGKLFDASKLRIEKDVRSRAYMAIIEHIKKQETNIAEDEPELAQKLRERHKSFQKLIKSNLSTLTVVRDVSKNLLKTISRKVGQAETLKTYGYQGLVGDHQEAVGYGLTVDRSL